MTTSYFDSSDVQQVLQATGTPALLIDAEIIRRQMREFQQALPGITPFYSVKTGPHPLAIDVMNEFQSHFDAATLDEIHMLLDHKVDPGGILYTHPAKTVAEITEAARLGVNAYTLDNLDELKRLQQHVPKAHLFLRLSPTVNSSLYNYEHSKFGATMAEARQILDYARDNDAQVSGISFMVGSQSLKLDPWNSAFQNTLELFNDYRDDLPDLKIVNIGSGFPLQYCFDKPVPTVQEIGRVVSRWQKKFPHGTQFIAEPGRFIIGPAAVIKSKVDRRLERDGKHWLYLDANAYGGLVELYMSNGAFRYPVTSEAGGKPEPFMVEGKTLDPEDIFGVNIPLGSKTTEGTMITIHDVGAYSTTFFSDYHNLPHPHVIVVDSKYQNNVELTTGPMGISGLRAKRAFQTGDVVFQTSGYFTHKRTRYTLQVDMDRHIEPTVPGAFLNHSCDPNVGVRTNKFGYYDVVARRHIPAGEEIAADYAMFEYETGPMSRVACLCGSPKCRKHITGYKDLPEAQRKAYEGYIADYLTKTRTTAHKKDNEPEAVAA